MFGLDRAKITLSYDFMSAVHHRILYQPEVITVIGIEWGVTLVGSDFIDSIAIIERKYNSGGRDQMSPQGRRCLEIIEALEVGKDVSDYPVVLIGIAQAFLNREAQVKQAYERLMAMVTRYDQLYDGDEHLYAIQNVEIDAIHAVDEPTQTLLAAVQQFGYTAPGNPDYLDIRRGLTDFPALATLPWFRHPEKPSALGLVTNAGLVWLNGLPIECSPWSTYSKPSFSAGQNDPTHLQLVAE